VVSKIDVLLVSAVRSAQTVQRDKRGSSTVRDNVRGERK
jgi:hypothetical protein